MVKTWGKFTSSEILQADTSLGCGTVSLSSTFFWWDHPVCKFGHFLFPWQIKKLRTNREGDIIYQYRFLLLCGCLIPNATEGVSVGVCRCGGFPYVRLSCSALAEMCCHKSLHPWFFSRHSWGENQIMCWVHPCSRFVHVDEPWTPLFLPTLAQLSSPSTVEQAAVLPARCVRVILFILNLHSWAGLTTG